jgi:hypothetical protein
MRNLVAKHDHNRAATHLDRSKEPQLSVDEGLLDYYAENAENVAQRVYDNESVRLFIGGTEVKGLVDFEPAQPLSEEDKKNRVLRVEMSFTPGYNPVLAEFMDSLVKR